MSTRHCQTSTPSLPRSTASTSRQRRCCCAAPRPAARISCARPSAARRAPGHGGGSPCTQHSSRRTPSSFGQTTSTWPLSACPQSTWPRCMCGRGGGQHALLERAKQRAGHNGCRASADGMVVSCLFCALAGQVAELATGRGVWMGQCNSKNMSSHALCCAAAFCPPEHMGGGLSTMHWTACPSKIHFGPCENVWGGSSQHSPTLIMQLTQGFQLSGSVFWGCLVRRQAAIP